MQLSKGKVTNPNTTISKPDDATGFDLKMNTLEIA